MKLKNLLLLTILLASACKSNQEENVEETAPVANEIALTDEQLKSFKIELGSVDNQSIVEKTALNGTVDILPQQRASVSFPVAAFVRSVLAVPNGFVHKGQTLATVSSMELLQIQQDYAQTLAQMQLHEQELTRQRTLVSEDVGAKRNLQAAEAALNTDKAILAGLKSKLNLVGLSAEKPQNTVAIVAPISGYVQNVGISVGKATTPADVLFEIANTDQQIIKLKAFEKDLPHLRAGEAFSTIVNGKAMNGTITTIGKAFSTADRTVEVYGKLNGQGIVGQYLTAQIGTKTRNATTLPEEAVVHEGELASIFVKIGDKSFRKEFVKLGVEQNGSVEIIPQKPLTNGKIVIKGAKLLAAELNKGGDEEE